MDSTDSSIDISLVGDSILKVEPLSPLGNPMKKIKLSKPSSRNELSDLSQQNKNVEEHCDVTARIVNTTTCALPGNQLSNGLTTKKQKIDSLSNYNKCLLPDSRATQKTQSSRTETLIINYCPFSDGQGSNFNVSAIKKEITDDGDVNVGLKTTASFLNINPKSLSENNSNGFTSDVQNLQTNEKNKDNDVSNLEKRLRQFAVLDEINLDEDEDSESQASEDVSDEEVYNMLDEQYEKGQEQSKDHYETEKVVLNEKVENHFEVLPDGWIRVSHESGMPVYLHRPSRVCTWSRPYLIGGASVRKHPVPVSSIPCYEYLKAKEKEAEKGPPIVVNGTQIPSATVETVEENNINHSLDSKHLREYCSKLFEFKTVKVVKFNSWPARRKFARRKRKLQRPTLPKHTKLITCPSDMKRFGTKKWILNPNGKSYVCILHAYVQRVLKQQPVYEFKEVENAATPYSAAIKINDMQYGVGFGSSKKAAKLEAAKATLETLIPEIKNKIGQDRRESGRAGQSDDTDLSFFDTIKIEDDRVPELCEKTTEPSPHSILLTCLQRNFSMNESSIKYETSKYRHSRNEFTMSVGPHKATVVCNNKRDGKQKASQAILKLLHPHIDSWGSLLRLYGNQSIKMIKAKKLEEQEITSLQSRAEAHSPNVAILSKLREEMIKRKRNQNAIKPIGTFIPPDDVCLPSGSIPEFNKVKL